MGYNNPMYNVHKNVGVRYTQQNTYMWNPKNKIKLKQTHI